MEPSPTAEDSRRTTPGSALVAFRARVEPVVETWLARQPVVAAALRRAAAEELPLVEPAVFRAVVAPRVVVVLRAAAVLRVAVALRVVVGHLRVAVAPVQWAT